MAEDDQRSRGEKRAHWTEGADRVLSGSTHPLWGLLGEDPDGEMWCPSWDGRAWWDRRLNLRRPTHWLPYLRSRITRKVAFLDG